ncbi:MAG: BspA family leucine-rich repeat surface protein [Cytophagales bacterium]
MGWIRNNKFIFCVFNASKLIEVPSTLPSTVTDLSAMFTSAISFNQPINSWNTVNVTNMSGMFGGASFFNQPISTWNTSNVTNMNWMFSSAISFNQSIGTWNTSNVTNMYSMFAGAKSFNHSLGSWNITKVTSLEGMFSGVGLCTTKYDSTLNGWASQAVKSNLSFDAGSSKYSSAGAAARAALISKGWSIYDGGLDTNPSNCGLVTETADVATSKPSNTAYPNPVAQGEVVNLGASNVNYSILNASGVEVMKGTQTSQIQTNTLPKGLYMLIINQSSQKLVVE